MNYETQYIEHLERLTQAPEKKDRTGTGTRSIFGHQIRHDLRDGFPLLTTKHVALKNIIVELLWFISGDTNIRYLKENGCNIWDAWADEEGNLGPVYGAMWRSWPTKDNDHIDQLHDLIQELRDNPTSRRLIVSAWNPELLPNPSIPPMGNVMFGKQALPPCHTLFQLNCEANPEGGYFVDLQLFQRSADWFLGVPYNAASYSLLLMMIAQVVNMTPRHFIHTFGDTHVYSNHVEQANEQIDRFVNGHKFDLPTVEITPQKDIDDYELEHFNLVGYESMPFIKAPISV